MFWEMLWQTSLRVWPLCSENILANLKACLNIVYTEATTRSYGYSSTSWGFPECVEILYFIYLPDF